MDTMKHIVMQECNEKRFSRKHIDGYLKEAITTNPLMVTKVNQGIQLVNEYMAKSYYESKNRRIAQLKKLDIEALVLDIFVGVCYSHLSLPRWQVD